MNLKPAISIPFPWLTILSGRLFGRPGALQPGTRPSPAFKFPRSLTISREGKWYIGILILIGIAAINTGNNLLYLIVATLLSFIVISGIMSETTLRGVAVSRTLPRHIFKDASVNVRLSVHNGKKHLPSFSFNVKESASPGVDAQGAYILKLGAGETRAVNAAYTFTRRGMVDLSGVSVHTRFPFALFRKGKEEQARDAVMVYPSIKASTKKYEAAGERVSGFRETPVKGPGTQLYNIRDYTAQDDARHIYWKSAARTSRLLLKEYEKEAQKKVLVIFENYSSAAADKAFEDAVDDAASIAAAFIRRGYAVGLKTLGQTCALVAGAEQLHRILRSLALITPAAPGKPGVRVVYL